MRERGNILESNSLKRIEKQINTLSGLRNLRYRFIKRTFDIICSLIGCIFLIPLMFIIKICYLITGDLNPIFYTQKRVGKYGIIIKIFKFRTMIPNADQALNELLKNEKYKKEWDLNNKLDNDPRITKIGKILRKTSIDEFPQFINVLKGDMSLIGPRPLVEGDWMLIMGTMRFMKVFAQE